MFTICRANQLTNERKSVAAGTTNSRFLSKTRQGVCKGDSPGSRVCACVIFAQIGINRANQLT